MSSRDPVYIEDVEAIAETPDALLIEKDGVEVWIPKSQIHDDSEVYEEDHVGTLVIPEWLAEDKGLA